MTKDLRKLSCAPFTTHSLNQIIVKELKKDTTSNQEKQALCELVQLLNPSEPQVPHLYKRLANLKGLCKD